MNAILRCHERFHLGERRGLSRHIYVVNGDQALPRYEFMCAAIDDCILSPQDAQEVLSQIAEVENGTRKQGSFGLNYSSGLFTKREVKFYFEFGPGGEEVEGGEVSLAQFKLAVQTYVRFLQDPERKPVEVPFPEE